MIKETPTYSPMRIAVIDSGFGGMNVVAGVERRLQVTRPDVQLLYINAAPSDEIGYNQMANTEQKQRVFRGVLDSVANRFEPTATFIACNTLASLLTGPQAPKPPGQRTSSLLELGASLVEGFVELYPSLPIVILGTPTTLEEGALEAAIRLRLSQDLELVGQACPGLHTCISNHPEAEDVRAKLRPFVRSALASLSQTSREVAVFLGCTHYGYRAELFKDVFKELGVLAHILDPTDAMSQEVVDVITSLDCPGSLESDLFITFWSRYPLPEGEISTISHHLQRCSPASAAAVRAYKLDTKLFPFDSQTF